MTVQAGLCWTWWECKLLVFSRTGSNIKLYSIVDETRTELSRFAKNFLPIFFNLYTADPVKEKDPVKLAVFETVKCYFQIADKLVGIHIKCINLI